MGPAVNFTHSLVMSRMLCLITNLKNVLQTNHGYFWDPQNRRLRLSWKRFVWLINRWLITDFLTGKQHYCAKMCLNYHQCRIDDSQDVLFQYFVFLPMDLQKPMYPSWLPSLKQIFKKIFLAYFYSLLLVGQKMF